MLSPRALTPSYPVTISSEGESSLRVRGKSVAIKGGKVLIGDRFPLFDQDGSLAEMGREIWSLIELEAEKIGRAFAHQYVASYNPGEAIDPAREAELVRLTTPYVALKFPDLGAQKRSEEP